MEHYIQTFVRDESDKRSFAYGWHCVNSVEFVEPMDVDKASMVVADAQAKFMSTIMECYHTAETTKVVWSRGRVTMGEFWMRPNDL